MNSRLTERMVWLDWMKVMAVFSVIWGHFFSEGHLYLYLFNVQVFCVVSGYLYHRSSCWKECLSKCFWRLLIPTVIMSVMIHFDEYVRFKAAGQQYEVSWWWFVKWFLLGHRWCMGPSWYFYSLIVMRIIMQMLPEQKWVHVLLFFVLSAGAVGFHYSGLTISNANTNVLLCMPLFLIGRMLQELKTILNSLHHFVVEGVLLVLAVSLVWFCGQYNGFVWMYLCDYGSSYILFIIGGMAGTLLLYILSLWLSRLPYRSMVTTLSQGSILVVGLHIIFVRRLTELPNRVWGEDLLYSLLILILFIPIVKLTKRFFPLLLGLYNVKNRIRT